MLLKSNLKKSLFFASLLLVGLFILSACTSSTSQAPTDMATDQIKSVGTGDEHLGCQEGEISVDGTCAVAMDNNALLFGQDLSGRVITADIDSGGALGYLARPSTDGDYPGVVMIHEWWGLNDNIKEMARLLADQGYVVFAVDLYGGKVATESGQAGELATAVRNNPEQAITVMQAAVDYLKTNENVSRIGSIGWCFGGGQSPNLSLGEPLDATVIYYGQLTDDKNELDKIAGPVLGIFGAQDTSIPVEAVNGFEAALNELGIKNDINIYDNVGHAFANPSGTSYAPEETVDAWNKTVAFFKDNLKNTVKGGLIKDDNAMMAEPGMVTFKLSGENFKFTMDGQTAPELRVKKGDKVRIEFTSIGGFHDWKVDEFDVATDRVNTGESAAVEFTASQAGTFEYYCSVGNHRAQGMVGKLIVE